MAIAIDRLSHLFDRSQITLCGGDTDITEVGIGSITYGRALPNRSVSSIVSGKTL